MAKCEERLLYLQAIDSPFLEFCGVHHRSQGKIESNVVMALLFHE